MRWLSIVLAGWIGLVLAARGESVDEAAKRVLAKKSFPFCQHSEEAMPPWDREWCEIQDQASTCPQIKEMCAREWKHGGNGWGADGRFHDGAGKLGEGESGGAPSSFNLPQIPGLGHISWIIAGVLLALIIAVVVKVVLDRKKVELPPLEEDEAPPPPMQIDLADPGLGEVAQLLAKARSAADRDVAHAMSLLYAALLRHLEDRGLIQWDRATTNRQYVREIRGRTPLDRPMADLVREVERTKFGHEPPSRSTFDDLFRRIAEGLPRAAAILLFAVLALSGCDCGDPGLNGHAAFNEVLNAQGIKTTRLSVPVDKVTAKDPPILVDSRDMRLDATLLHSLKSAVDKGARVLLLSSGVKPYPAWPSLLSGETKDKELRVDQSWALAMGLDANLQGSLPAGLKLGYPESEDEKHDVLIRRGADPFAVRLKSDSGELVVVADRMLLANASMAVPGNAQMAVALAKEVVGDRHELSTAALGPSGGSESPADSLAKSGLLPLMLEALLALGVLFWARGAAFGALRDRSKVQRRSFSEHVSALGTQFAQNSGSRFAASLYAAYALERLWRRAGQDVDRNDSPALAAVIARRVNRSEAELQALLQTAEALRREPNGIAIPEKDLTTIRQLSSLLAELRAD